MRNPDLIADPQLVDFDVSFGAASALEHYDVFPDRQSLQDDLAEVPQAFAAYLDYEQNQRS